jgi:adenylyl-sulfate kinase
MPTANDTALEILESRTIFILREAFSCATSPRKELQLNQGFTVWLTGLSGAGKSTIAERLAPELTARGRKVEVLDGDEVRTHLSKGLGFSREDRDINIGRISFVASLLVRHGAAVITAAISPYAQARAEARQRIGSAHFVEVYVRCSLEELKRRDVKGLYSKAIAGELKHFTGISDPYEAPENPDVVVDSEVETVEESVSKILAELQRRGLVHANLKAAL